jgi:hypothetical protein
VSTSVSTSRARPDTTTILLAASWRASFRALRRHPRTPYAFRQSRRHTAGPTRRCRQPRAADRRFPLTVPSRRCWASSRERLPLSKVARLSVVTQSSDGWMYFSAGSLAGLRVDGLDMSISSGASITPHSPTAGRPSCAIPPARSALIRRQIDDEPRCSTRRLTREESVHSRTPISLGFLVTLPSVEARGRWRERGRMGGRYRKRD